jgi:hypothetical protein
MKKSAISWNVKQFNRMYQNGKISFDYPIQREGGQWDHLQKSLLIHSLADDFPVPSLYTISEEKVYFVLDGKQRLTSIIEFLNDEYPLHEETPSAEVEEETFELAGKLFSELDEIVQDQIQSFMLLNYKLDDTTDEQIEDLFYRLNNGTPLTKQQKAKAKMGTEWANKIKDLVNHPLMQEKASFTKLQLRKADNETAILQTMMLLDPEHSLKSISSNDVFKYTQEFKEDADNKDKLVSNIKEYMDYLEEALDKKETVLLKKVNFPMTFLTVKRAIELEVAALDFGDWISEFKNALKGKGDTTTDYKDFSGAGSVKREKTIGRANSMKCHFEEYFKQTNIYNFEKQEV